MYYIERKRKRENEMTIIIYTKICFKVKIGNISISAAKLEFGDLSF